MKPIFSPTKMLDSIILMHIVKEGPLHGYALVASIEEHFGWKPSQTAIYNSLKSMESEEKIEVEEKIESGRVQKIYSITKKGRESVKEIRKHMKEHMMNNMLQFFSFIQQVGEFESLEESELFQKRVHVTLENLRSIPPITMMLFRTAPKETQEVIENTVESLKKLAKKHEIDFSEEVSKYNHR